MRRHSRQRRSLGLTAAATATETRQQRRSKAFKAYSRALSKARRGVRRMRTPLEAELGAKNALSMKVVTATATTATNSHRHSLLPCLTAATLAMLTGGAEGAEGAVHGGIEAVFPCRNCGCWVDYYWCYVLLEYKYKEGRSAREQVPSSLESTFNQIDKRENPCIIRKCGNYLYKASYTS
mmetsp:Transcript_26301/g.44892  ORF Transcript_26301/g.44892 Transcript_26301/m.44892 type:complete len:180 (+) Transcript_26301:754-1293(+)